MDSAIEALPKLLALISAAWIQHARDMSRDKVMCLECNRSGAANPHCYLCKGDRYVKVRRLYALGWKKEDLEDVEDGEALCPSSDCNGDSCCFCGGDAQVSFHFHNQQIRRILLYARYEKLIETRYYDWSGRLQKSDDLLATWPLDYLTMCNKGIWHEQRGKQFHHRDVVTRSRSILGDGLSRSFDDEEWPEIWRHFSRQAAMERLLHFAGRHELYRSWSRPR